MDPLGLGNDGEKTSDGPACGGDPGRGEDEEGAHRSTGAGKKPSDGGNGALHEYGEPWGGEGNRSIPPPLSPSPTLFLVADSLGQHELDIGLSPTDSLCLSVGIGQDF